MGIVRKESDKEYFKQGFHDILFLGERSNALKEMLQKELNLIKERTLIAERLKAEIEDTDSFKEEMESLKVYENGIPCTDDLHFSLDLSPHEYMLARIKARYVRYVEEIGLLKNGNKQSDRRGDTAEGLDGGTVGSGGKKKRGV